LADAQNPLERPLPDGIVPAAQVARTEKRWLTLMVGMLIVMMAVVVLTGVTNAIHPPSNVETIDPTTLHLAGEFVASAEGPPFRLSRVPAKGVLNDGVKGQIFKNSRSVAACKYLDGRCAARRTRDFVSASLARKEVHHCDLGSATVAASKGAAAASNWFASIKTFPSMLVTDSRKGASRRVPRIGASATSISLPSERYLTKLLDGLWPAIGS
jgi:hypothetical protein